MIIALLFNWKAYPAEKNYWDVIRKLVFKTGIIQKSGRHMKLAIGDVLVGIEQGQDARKLYQAAFLNSEFRLVEENRLINGFPTVFAMVFENMPRMLAAELDSAIRNHKAYLGAISVHLEFPPHLALYRLSLPPQYRVHGNRLRSFFTMGTQDDCDPKDLIEMKRLGYSDVAFEDIGLSRTIFDDFDTPRHFQRVAAFRTLLSSGGRFEEDEVYQLLMLLEDLNPKLFNTLGAAAERLSTAENEEDLAQVALSGRRYMEQLADALFPPVQGKRAGRSLNSASYKNRLWAFAEDHNTSGLAGLHKLGLEVDRVVNELNSGLHGIRSKERIAASIGDAAVLTLNLFSLAPEKIRNGYLGYIDSLRSFVEELATSNEERN